MREFGKVNTTFWSSPTIASLSDDGRLLALYLMTCTHATIAGVFRLPDGYAAEDLRWDVARVREGFAELLANGFANRCETTKWVWVVKHLIWNPLENPNQRKAAAKVAAAVPDGCAWKPAFLLACGPFFDRPALPAADPSETVPEPLPNQEQEQEQEKEQEHPPPPRKRGRVQKSSPGFDDFWLAYPRKVAKLEAEKAFAKLKPDEALLRMMLAAIDRQRSWPQWTKGDGDFIPHPATWLKNQRWLDAEPATARRLPADDIFAGAL